MLESTDDPLDSSEPPVDRLPARRDELDQELEIVETLTALGADLRVELPDHAGELLEEHPHVAHPLGAGLDLDVQRLVQHVDDPLRKPRLELGSSLRERLEKLLANGREDVLHRRRSVVFAGRENLAAGSLARPDLGRCEEPQVSRGVAGGAGRRSRAPS